MARKHHPNAAHLRVRLASSLLSRLEQAARRNEQSMNAEIIKRLEHSFAKDDTAKLIQQTAETALNARRARIEALQEQLRGSGSFEGKLSAGLGLHSHRLDMHSERLEKIEKDVLDLRTSFGIDRLIATLEERGFIRRPHGTGEAPAPDERKSSKRGEG